MLSERIVNCCRCETGTQTVCGDPAASRIPEVIHSEERYIGKYVIARSAATWQTVSQPPAGRYAPEGGAMGALPAADKAT